MQELKNYRTAFRTLSILVVVVVLAAFVAVGGLGYYFISETKNSTERIWIVDPKSSTVIAAVQSSEANNPAREFEYKNHIKMFYQYWFGLDQFNYKKNTDIGLQLVGNSGKGLLAKYQQDEMHKKLAEYNMTMTVEVDSVICNMSATPVKCACYARQKIITPGGQYERYINATMQMIDQASRSEVNPHGVLIENYEFFNTNKIEAHE